MYFLYKNATLFEVTIIVKFYVKNFQWQDVSWKPGVLFPSLLYSRWWVQILEYIVT